jgi:hypothetical protein
MRPVTPRLEIPLPPKLAGLQAMGRLNFDHRLPVPYVDAINTHRGMKSINPEDAAIFWFVARHRLCAYCGQALMTDNAFIGDEDALQRRMFIESPMHETCMRYWLAVRPNVVLGWVRRTPRKVLGKVVAGTMGGPPYRVCLVVVRTFRFRREPDYPQLPLYLLPTDNSRDKVTWFVDGTEAS